MAITYGMSVKEFWEDSPDLFWAYRFSYYNQIIDEQERFNANAWLQGAYFYEAISIALNNSFSKNKAFYPKLPHGINETTIDDKKTQQEQLVAKIKGRIAQVQAIKGKELENKIV